MAALNGLIGQELGPVAAGAAKPPQVDIVSGATVTVLVMGDSVVRSAVTLIRSGRLTGVGVGPAAVEVGRELDPSKTEIRDWDTLLGDGSVRSLRLTIGEVSEAFTEIGQLAAAGHPETGGPEGRFIELYVAPVSVPSIGRSLLGEAGFDRLAARLEPGQAALMVAGDGAYSFKGSAYVRGGIFDRIELIQDGQGIRFRDRNHTRLNGISAAGAPRLKEVALFVVPRGFRIRPDEAIRYPAPRPARLRGSRQGDDPLRSRLHAARGLHAARARTCPGGGRAGADARARRPVRRRSGSPALGLDLADEKGSDRRDRRRDRRADDDLLLPEHARPPPAAAEGRALQLPRLHPRLARLDREHPAFGRQRPHLPERARQRLFLGVLPLRAARVHSLGGGRRRPALLGPRAVLRLALPVRRAAGVRQPRRQAPAHPADQRALVRCTNASGRSST